MADYGGLDPILFQTPESIPFPNTNPDPALLERMKALAFMRMGTGMMSREPLGNSMGAAINTYVSGQEQARREALAQGQLALEHRKLEKATLADQQEAAVRNAAINDPQFRARLLEVGGPALLAAVIQGGAKEIRGIVENLTGAMGPGQTRTGLGGNTFNAVPDASGRVNMTANGQPYQYVVPGALGATYATKSAEEAARLQAENRYKLQKLPVSGTEERFVTPELYSTMFGGGIPQQPGGPTWNGVGAPTPSQLSQIARGFHEPAPSPSTAQSGGLAPRVSPGGLPTATEQNRLAEELRTQEEARRAKNLTGEMGVRDQQQRDLGAWYDQLKTTGEMNTQWDTTRRYITQYDAVKKQVKLEGKLANFWYDNMYKIATSASKIPGMEDLKPASQAPADVMRSITMHMLLGVRNSKSGEGAPGNLAVQEWGFLGDSVPNLSQSSEGRDLIMEMYRTSADFVNEKYRTMERLTNEKVAKNPSSVSEARMELGEKLDNKMMEQGFLYRVDADKILKQPVSQEREEAAKVLRDKKADPRKRELYLSLIRDGGLK